MLSRILFRSLAPANRAQVARVPVEMIPATAWKTPITEPARETAAISREPSLPTQNMSTVVMKVKRTVESMTGPEMAQMARPVCCPGSMALTRSVVTQASSRRKCCALPRRGSSRAVGPRIPRLNRQDARLMTNEHECRMSNSSFAIRHSSLPLWLRVLVCDLCLGIWGQARAQGQTPSSSWIDLNLEFVLCGPIVRRFRNS